MKPVILAVALASAVLPVAAQGAGVNDFKDFGNISDVGLRAIEAAMPELRHLHPDWQDNTISASRMDGRLVVTFCPKKNQRTINFVDGAGSTIASIPQCPGSLWVELDQNTLKVLDVGHNRD